jgi:hypothetical protein
METDGVPHNSLTNPPILLAFTKWKYRWRLKGRSSDAARRWLQCKPVPSPSFWGRRWVMLAPFHPLIEKLPLLERAPGGILAAPACTRMDEDVMS